MLYLISDFQAILYEVDIDHLYEKLIEYGLSPLEAMKVQSWARHAHDGNVYENHAKNIRIIAVVEVE